MFGGETAERKSDRYHRSWRLFRAGYLAVRLTGGSAEDAAKRGT